MALGRPFRAIVVWKRGDARTSVYNAFGKSGQRAAQRSLRFCACFIEQSAISSSSQSTILALLPRSAINLSKR
jgi:hypothetical protein